ncbi:MAG: hypothetical protein GKR95_15845 [Gammaproteobacteria bacterium]|nr:hypothetical protein [Gammaproteobacteria bacterium]
MLPDSSSQNERRNTALKLQSMLLKNAERFHRVMDKPSTMPDNMEIFSVIGDAKKTEKQMLVDSITGQIEVTEFGAGDGTVLRSSALMDEREGAQWKPHLVSPIDWTSVLFLPANHLGLTRDNTFTDNVLYWLLEAPK